MGTEVKIFGIGLGRTGTTSLAKALEILGYSCVHYPHDDAAIEAHDAAVDETVTCQFRKLAYDHPGAKFIYTSRPIRQWVDSYARCFGAIVPGTEVHPVIAKTYRKIYGQVEFNREVWERTYSAHALDVCKFFEIHKSNKLLKLNIMNGDGWEKLCLFLNKPIPEEDFPWANRGPDFPS